MQQLLHIDPSEQSRLAQEQFPVAFGAGEFAGYAAPFMVPETFLPQLARLPAVVRGAASIGGISALMKPEEGELSRLQAGILGGVVGGAAPPLVGLAQRGVRAVSPAVQRAIKVFERKAAKRTAEVVKPAEIPKPPPVQPAPKIEAAAPKTAAVEAKPAPSLKALQDEYEKLVLSPQQPSAQARVKELSAEITRRLEAGEVPSAGRDTTLAFMGANPDIMRAAGEDAVRAARVVSNATADLIRSTQTPPKVLAGVKQARVAMINHDRATRAAGFTRLQLRKVIDDVVPNRGQQMSMIHAYEGKLRGKNWNQLSEIEKGALRWAAQEKAKLNKFVRDNKILKPMSEEEVNHIRHWWINPKTGSPYPGMYGKFSESVPQAKPRSVSTYQVGIDKYGMKPATTNIGELIGLDWESATRAYQARNMFKLLNSIKTQSGDQIILRRGRPPRDIRFVERWDQLRRQGLAKLLVFTRTYTPSFVRTWRTRPMLH
jgi:hypothetical protein